MVFLLMRFHTFFLLAIVWLGSAWICWGQSAPNPTLREMAEESANRVVGYAESEIPPPFLTRIDPTLNSNQDQRNVLLDEHAISEQLKQLRQELDELKQSRELAGSDVTDDKLETLDEEIQKQKQKLDEHDLLFEDLVTLGHGDEAMSLFGRIHIDHWGFPQADPGIELLEGGDPADRFAFRRMRLGVKGDIRDNTFYKIEMEFAEGREPSYRDAFLGFKSLPFLNTLTIGNHKRPYGLDHLNSSRYNIFIERPFIIEALNQDARRLGISSRGVAPDQSYNWQYGVYHQELTQTRNGFVNDHYQPELAGRFAWMPWFDDCSGGRGYMHLAVAGSLGFPDGLDATNNAARYRTRPEARTQSRWLNTGRIAGADEALLLATEAVFNAGPLQLVAELQALDLSRRNGFGNHVNLNGGYVYLAYMLTGEHVPWNRKTGTLGRVKPFENFWRVRDCNGRVQNGLGAWQFAARYSHADLTDENILGGIGDSYALGLNWYWNPYARMQFNYIYGDIDRGAVGGGNYQILGTRFMIDF